MFWKQRLSGVVYNRLLVVITTYIYKLESFQFASAVILAFRFEVGAKKVSYIWFFSTSTPSLFIISALPFSAARSLNCAVLVSLFFCDLWPINQGWGSTSEERRERWVGGNGCFRPGFITPGWEMVGSVCACVRAPVVFPLSGHL